MIEGKVFKFGRDINTDLIIAGRHSHLSSITEKAKHIFEDVDPQFINKFTPGGIIVAGENFGCGSSREIAADILKVAGVNAIVASSFARTFYRNALNIGLPIFEVPGIDKHFKEGEVIRIDPGSGIILNVTSGLRFQTAPFPPFLLSIISCGGLVNYLNKELEKN